MSEPRECALVSKIRHELEGGRTKFSFTDVQILIEEIDKKASEIRKMQNVIRDLSKVREWVK